MIERKNKAVEKNGGDDYDRVMGDLKLVVPDECESPECEETETLTVFLLPGDFRVWVCWRHVLMLRDGGYWTNGDVRGERQVPHVQHTAGTRQEFHDCAGCGKQFTYFAFAEKVDGIGWVEVFGQCVECGALTRG